MEHRGKHYRILEEICFPNFPGVWPTKASRDIALANPHFFNIEHLVEQAMADIGGYKWVDQVGYDFNDKDLSDAKTCTLRRHDNGLSINKIESKVGSFRIVVYNEITDSLDYFYLTKLGRESYVERGYLKKDRNQERIRATFTESRDSYNKLEKFRVKSFTELAKMTDAKMEKKHPNLLGLISKKKHFDKLFKIAA